MVSEVPEVPEEKITGREDPKRLKQACKRQRLILFVT
jgi:hypothetical protein